MTEGEIANLFIRAAETERKMPRAGERPKGFGGYVLPFVHSAADVSGWGKQIGDNLVDGDDPLNKDWRWGWFDQMARRLTVGEVSDWEVCMSLVSLCLDDEAQRRALWAWAKAKAGGKPFARWCRSEGIAEITGQRRKNRALSNIRANLARAVPVHTETGQFGVLPDAHEIRDIPATVEGEAGRRNDPNFWAPDAAFKSFIDLTSFDRNSKGAVQVRDEKFSLSEFRNMIRRQRDARKRAA